MADSTRSSAAPLRALLIERRTDELTAVVAWPEGDVPWVARVGEAWVREPTVLETKTGDDAPLMNPDASMWEAACKAVGVAPEPPQEPQAPVEGGGTDPSGTETP